MRYEFEVGDYVKLIANKTISSKPIGYIGKVLRTKMFPGFGVCCALDSDDMSWSQFSDLAPATKAEYEAYHKVKMPKYVKLLGGRGLEYTLNKIYKVEDGRIRNDNDYLPQNKLVNLSDYYSYQFEASTKEAYEAQNKPKPKFKVGDDEFKVGNWVKVKPDAKDSSAGRNLPGFILKIGSIGDNYNEKGKHIGGYKDSNSYVNNYSHGIYFNELVPATYEEIKQHLLAEASRRGFKVGVDYTLNGSRNTAKTNPELYSNTNSKFNLHCGYGCGLIYNDSTGEWATIISDEKTLCGHKVEQPKSSSYMKIGCKTISKAEVQTFLNLCEKFDITKVMSGYVKDKSITLDAIKEALK